MAVRRPLVALSARPAMPEDIGASGEGAWALTDPGSNMSLAGGSGALRRLLRPEVLEMQRRATGRVLDIGGPLAGGFAYESVSELVVAPPQSLGERGDEPFDVVCSFGALAAAPCLETLVAMLRPLVASDGRLLFVELDGDARRWRRRLDGLARRRWGMSMACHVTAALWAGGFEVTSLDRRRLRGRSAGLLRVVVGAARPDPHRLAGHADRSASGVAP
ncbi:MAG: hypothetical protein F4121_02135 [Acidimicrobiia bacterium]|nr:hypothetical protein [Acidimicrobiia bacterium]MYC45856.1 hypothetical protein [Acidimicrobiia bacterium]MYI18911.1 hypothetical protein [Acidimicrobiia bacterium]